MEGLLVGFETVQSMSRDVSEATGEQERGISDLYENLGQIKDAMETARSSVEGQTEGAEQIIENIDRELQGVEAIGTLVAGFTGLDEDRFPEAPALRERAEEQRQILSRVADLLRGFRASAPELRDSPGKKPDAEIPSEPGIGSERPDPEKR